MRNIFHLFGFSLILKEVLSVSPDWPAVCPDIISRARWQGRIPHAVDYAIIPIQYVVIHHTVTDECSTEDECARTIREIQNFHIDTLEFHDIGYNFIIGGDGNVYEGAGWHKVGAHTRGYNSRSIGIAFIGNFSDKLPNKVMLNALKQFLRCAVELGELDRHYKLFGARQVSATASPGRTFYAELRNWSHFTNSP